MEYEELFNAIHNGAIDFKKPVLFYIELDDCLDNAYDFEICMRLLPLSIQQKILNRKSMKDKQLKLINQLILPFVQSLYHRTNNVELPNFNYNKFGKPLLDNIGFNISDEDDMVSIIVKFGENSEWGCDLANLKDIERFNTEGEFLDSFKDIFAMEEFEYIKKIEDIDEQNVVLTQYWALKESYSKLLGIGLNESFQKFNFQDRVALDIASLESCSTKQEIYKGLIKFDDVKWNHYPLTADDYNYITSLNSNIVCSVFSSSPIRDVPLVVNVKLELLINFIKCSSSSSSL